MRNEAALGALLILAAFHVDAAQTTVTLEVAGMTCAACPITVKKALTKLDGVAKAEVDYDKRQAIVTFDDAKTNVQTLTRATTDAGFPSTVKAAAR